MVTMTWGRRPPVAGRPPEAMATLQAPTSPSRDFCGLDRRSSSVSSVPAFAGRLSAGCRRAAGVIFCAGGGAGVGGGVHHGEQGLELFGGGEDFPGGAGRGGVCG